MGSFVFNYWSIIGPGRHYGLASGSHQQQRGRAQYAQPHANTSQARDRRESLSRYASVSQHGAHPNLPKSGAQRLAKQSSRGEIQADFMRTPDPGQSGYVDIYLMCKVDACGCSGYSLRVRTFQISARGCLLLQDW